MLNCNVMADATLSLLMSMLHLKPQSVIRLHIVYFVHSCFQPVFLFLLSSFFRLFLDTARYVCKKSNENMFNIKQKSRLNSNTKLELNSCSARGKHYQRLVTKVLFILYTARIVFLHILLTFF